MNNYKILKNLDNVKKGKIGEEIARRYLVLIGMKIICSNYKTKFGEIDIIAKLENKKIGKITSVAKHYLLTNNIKNCEIRFDVIEVYFNEEKINHIENAF